MSLYKKGTPHKITDVSSSESEFEKLKSRIAADNNLKRCTCGQLLAKFDSKDKVINIQRKNMDMIAEVSTAEVKCPSCGTINKLI